MAKTTITIDKIIEDANRIKILNDSYLFSYPHFKRYFTDIKGDFTEHDLIIGIHFIYGWMPTIFEFKNGKTGKESIFEDKIIRKNISEAVEIVNKIRREDSDLTPSNYDLLKKLFNNSLVGTSKFLHFINSDKFAIWDSNVLAFLMTEKELVNSIGINNVIESIPNYMEYLSLLG
ncbi:MAG TPA: hypothetical protein VJ602_01820, partial [Paludibacter sp.]|nr:hypothetical protein [Paludibacter sp.]